MKYCKDDSLECHFFSPNTRECSYERKCPYEQYTSEAVKGVSPDTPIVANEQGGKQSKTAYGFHLCDTGAMLALAETLQYGATRYARDNWRKIPSEEHFNHMLIHWYAYISGDRSDNHLAHMFCRAMMAYATARAEEAGKEKE